MDHVKLLGQLFDRCQLVLVQLVEFLSRSKEQANSVSANQKYSYLELLPDLQTLCIALFCVQNMLTVKLEYLKVFKAGTKVLQKEILKS